MLDVDMNYIIFNNIRRDPGGSRKYLNSTYVLNKSIDYLTEEYIYDKIMILGIESIYTRSGPRKRRRYLSWPGHFLS